MAANISNIYQLKITLKRIKPNIWRRIQVPENYSFKDLHLAIQVAMGWESFDFDYHLHQFEMINPETGLEDRILMPDAGLDDFCDPVPEDEAKIAKYFLTPKSKAIYDYDFGDGWQHEVMLEKILPAVVGADYPKCIGGKRACPPEDCGGIGGYYSLLEIIADPNHEEYKERMEWLMSIGREGYNPEEFDPRSVEFRARLNLDESESDSM